MSRRKRKAVALSLMVGALIALAAACETGSPTPGPATGSSVFGLREDPNVDMVWPEAPLPSRVRYYNSVRAGADFLASDETIVRPRAVAIDNALERLYISEMGGLRVVDLANGEMFRMAEEIEYTGAIAVGPEGNVFVVDIDDASVAVFTSDDHLVRRITGFTMPKGIAVDAANGRLYVPDAQANDVSVFTLEGRFLFKLRPSADAPLVLPLQVAINSEGLVYVLNWGVNKVQIFDTNGNYVRSFGTEGNVPGYFVHPKGIAIDSDDNVWVSDNAFSKVQVFDAQDRLAIFFGDIGNGPGQFDVPGLMAFDDQNRLFIPEYHGNRVQVFEYLSQ